jgi:3-hydroxyacyl-CoA dehydrogenase/enoyl-CoA hydratase/3-hydroxybutyryl-CoA epimerase
MASVELCGFPAATGGAIQFVNRLGVDSFVARAEELAARYGERFLPPARLKDLASRGERIDDAYAGRRSEG